MLAAQPVEGIVQRLAAKKYASRFRFLAELVVVVTPMALERQGYSFYSIDYYICVVMFMVYNGLFLRRCSLSVVCRVVVALALSCQWEARKRRKETYQTASAKS